MEALASFVYFMGDNWAMTALSNVEIPALTGFHTLKGKDIAPGKLPGSRATRADVQRPGQGQAQGPQVQARKGHVCWG